MKIESLNFTGFRNLEDLKITLDPGISVWALVGQNGQGKTNFLEALYLLALSKSFRTDAAEELIGFGRDYARLEAGIESASDDRSLEWILMRETAKKGLKINGVLQKTADFVGRLKVVFFSPDEMVLLSYAPLHRRRYLDVTLSQLDRDYLRLALEYQHGLSQRNGLLRRIAEGAARENELEFWDEALLKAGLPLMEKRAALIEAFGPAAEKHYRAISRGQESIIIEYRQSAGKGTEAAYREALEKSRARDLATRSTHVGPHRDDLQFFCDGHDMLAFSSRGEWRTLVLALKLAEIDRFREKSGEYPVLLLDDVFSELDQERQTYLLNAIRPLQTFVTTNHAFFLEPFEGPQKIVTIENGRFLVD